MLHRRLAMAEFTSARPLLIIGPRKELSGRDHSSLAIRDVGFQAGRGTMLVTMNSPAG